ncbi:FabD/lysophospholipase-like protein [Colletotrichum falcatum]|nr:FabD/lysophospholipase-like protein [Colletotrichum falcatum]
MRRLQEVAGLKEEPKPRDFFHLIGGTSTGGLIAIMLGRMGMTATEAIDCYERFSKKVFSKKNRRFDRTFREQTLERLIRDIVAQRKLRTTVMLDTGREKGLAFVCAATYNNYTPYLFRTYRGNSSLTGPAADAPGTRVSTHNHAHNVEIWEAARATTAAPTLFHPITIKVEAEKDDYVDGALKFNNPARLVLNEAESQFGSGRKLGFLLSLGTGLKSADNGVNFVPSGGEVARSTEPARKNSGALLSRGTFKVLKHAKQSVTDPEPTHHALEERFRGTPYAYFRLNLDRGAADIKIHQYKKMKVLRAATEEYLRKVQVSADIDKVVSMLHKNEGVNMPLDAACRAVSDEASKQAVAQEIQVKGIASPQFTGRTEILEKMDRHFCQRAQPSPRRHLRIWGMGGVGKTQIALKFRDLYGSRFARVFWINAATEDSIYESLRVTTAELFGGEPTKPDIGRVHQWLERNTKEEWLVVFDNNDSTDISKYIPPGNAGNILFTSRRNDVSPSLDVDQILAVETMKEDDALALLYRASKRQNQALDSSDEKDGKDIVRELGYLPLAIDQASSYVLNQDCSLGTYLRVFQARRNDILGDPLHRGAFEANPAVYGTFELSYEALVKLSKESTSRGRAATNALRILNVFCFYNNENIPSEIISRAATNRKIDREALGNAESLAPLALFDLKDDKSWNDRNYLDGISLLRSYSLIKKSVAHDDCHSMHVLVHSWARDRMHADRFKFQRHAARSIIFDCFHQNFKFEDERFLAQLLPHIKPCLGHEGLEGMDWFKRTRQDSKYARLLSAVGMWREALWALEGIVAERRENLAPNNWLIVAALWDLGQMYKSCGNLGLAEETLLESMNLLKNCSEKRWANRVIMSIGIDLAEVYIQKAELGTAQKMLTWIAECEEEKGGRSSQLRRAVAALATTMQLAGHIDEAESLEATSLAWCRENPNIGEGHRATMRAISNIATLRSAKGQHESADEMWRHVLDVDERFRGKEHPITLQSKRNVAIGCVKLNKLREAERLLREVLDVGERVLWREHPDMLMTMEHLAGVLYMTGEVHEALELQEECLDGRVNGLGDDHPLTIKTREGLETMRVGAVIPVAEQVLWQSEGTLLPGDSNLALQSMNDRYLY